jgi:superfamily II DNA or RNA helicase
MVGLTLLYPDVEWLVLVHRTSLLHQTAERFVLRTGEAPGKIGDGELSPGRITIAMAQTLVSLSQKAQWREWLAARQGLIFDEAHVLPAPSFYRLAQRCTGAYFRYGFSGTPFARGDQRNVFLLGAIGPTIHRVRSDQLVEAGVIARPSIRMIPVAQLIQKTSWRDVYTRGVVSSEVRNKAVIKTTVRAKKPCLVFVSQLEHGKKLLKMLSKKGIEAEFVFGKHNSPQRTAAIRRLVHGDTDVLIANVIFQEGVDIPELQSVVIAAGGKSTIAVLQDLGRGMRKHARNGKVTKEEVEIYDFLDTGNVWLQKHSRERLRAYTKERHKVVIDGSK